MQAHSISLGVMRINLPGCGVTKTTVILAQPITATEKLRI